MSSANLPNDFIYDMKNLFSSSLRQQEKSENVDVKGKVKETLNNWRYKMNIQNKLKSDKPLWLLGVCYNLPSEEEVEDDWEKIASEDSSLSNDENKKCDYREFIEDFNSRIWFTYRKGFRSLPGCDLTTDTGWGCMLRTAQMMLSQALVTHFLSREWRWKPNHLNLEEADCHRNIIKWFLDEPNQKCPFGIHSLVEHGQNQRCKAGDWYGPVTAANILQSACVCAKSKNPKLNNFQIYVSQFCTIFKKDVEEIFIPLNDANQSNSVLILVPLRLGSSRTDPHDITILKKILTFKQSTGIIGGRTHRSLYFLGYQDEHFLYLDPHYCKPADTLATFSNSCIPSYHNRSPRKMNCKKLNPSCCIGFYCRDLEDFHNLIKQIEDLMPSKHRKYPIFNIAVGSYVDVKEPEGIKVLKADCQEAGTSGIDFDSDFEILYDSEDLCQ